MIVTLSSLTRAHSSILAKPPSGKHLRKVVSRVFLAEIAEHSLPEGFRHDLLPHCIDCSSRGLVPGVLS